MPIDDFVLTANVLDQARLNKQRLEVRLLLEELDLTRPNTRWNTHPCVRMWRGHAEALKDYGIAICQEWLGRDLNDAQLPKIEALWNEGHFEFNAQGGYYPDWFGVSAFHAAHRSNLLRKKPEWYSKFEWEESDDLEYIWPVGGKTWPKYDPESTSEV